MLTFATAIVVKHGRELRGIPSLDHTHKLVDPAGEGKGQHTQGSEFTSWEWWPEHSRLLGKLTHAQEMALNAVQSLVPRDQRDHTSTETPTHTIITP